MLASFAHTHNEVGYGYESEEHEGPAAEALGRRAGQGRVRRPAQRVSRGAGAVAGEARPGRRHSYVELREGRAGQGVADLAHGAENRQGTQRGREPFHGLEAGEEEVANTGRPEGFRRQLRWARLRH